MKQKTYTSALFTFGFISSGWKNILYVFLISVGNLFLFIPTGVFAANRYAVANGNWSATSTWSASSNGSSGASIPIAGDAVFIAEGGNTRTVTIPAGYAAACTSITIGNLTDNTIGALNFSTSTSTLTVSGNLVMNRPISGATLVIGLGAGSLTVLGDLELSHHTSSNSSSNRINRINISTGVLTINGNLIYNGEHSSQSQIVFSGAGTLNIGGNFTIPFSLGTLTPNTSTTNFFGTTVAQIIPIGVSAVNYYNITFNNTNVDGATLSANITSSRVGGNIGVQTGTLNNGGFAITLSLNDNFIVSNGATFILTGTSTMVSTSGTGIKTFGTTSITRYSGGDQTVSAEAYGNLELSSSTSVSKTFAGATSIEGNLSISGSAVAILPNGSTSTAMTLTLGGVNQASGSWGGSISSATNKSATWFGTTTTGILNINIGCIDGTWLGVFSTDWNDAGNWCGGIPTATTVVIIPSTPPNQPVIGIIGGIAKNITIDASATLTISGAYTLAVSGNWTNNGTFTPGTSTVNFNLASGTQTVNNGTSQFYKLTHSGTGTLQLLTNSIIVNNVLLNSAGTLNANNLNITLKGTWSNSSTFTAGTGTVFFTGTSAQNIAGTSINSFNNLTINNTSGVTSSSDFAVNGILNLQSANPSVSVSNLAMGTKTLTMGGSATTIGIGDVTGIVKRTSFVAGTAYTFGNQFTTITFQGGGTFPTQLSMKITIGAAATWKSNSILRVYELIQAGAVGSFATFNVHYLDSELNGNNENTLVYWYNYFPFSAGTEVELGRSNYDLTDNWIGVSSLGLDGFPTGFGQVEATLGGSALANYTWNGSLNTDWINAENWTPNGNPSDLSDVIIPDAGTTPNDPLLPTTSAAVKRLTINSGGILNATSTSSLTVVGGSGAWINNGGIFNASISTVIFTNAAATIAGTTNFYDLMINSGAGLTMGSNSTIRIAGTITNNGTWNAALNSLTTVEYNGSNQTVLNPNGSLAGYHNLILSGSGTKTMPGTALNILGDFSMSGTASATALAAMTITGGFTLGSGTTFITGSLSHSIGKNFTNNGGTFTATGSTITLNGTTAQTLGGTTASTFNNLILNNTAGALLGINETVSGILTLTNGKITTGTNSLIVSNPSTSAISGASSSKYINGNLQLNIAAGANTYAYPIGTATVYAPVSIAFTSGTTAGTLTGFTTNGDHPSIATSTLAPTSSVNRYWRFVVNSGLTTANYGATYNWVAADKDPPFTFSTAVVGKYNSPTWIYPTVGTRTATSIQISGATSFGDFQVANGCSVYTATLSGTSTICSGSSANLIVTMSGGISPYTVVYTGGSGGTITNYISGSNIPITPAGTTTYTLTSVTDAGGCMATISGSSVTITLTPSGTWTGTTSTDWNTSSNWCGGVPTSTTDVIITSTPTNQPVIGAAGGLSRNITIGSGSTLSITGTNTLTVSGNWTKPGTFVPNSSTVIFDGASAATISTGNFNNVTFSGAGIKTATGILTIAGNVNISNNFTAGAFTHTVGGNWTRTGTFTSTGSTIDFNGSTAGNIGTSNFNNITFSGSGVKTSTGVLTIVGNVIIANNFSASSFTHTLSGNWINNGTFIPDGGTIVFSGTFSKSISGTSETTFNNLTISNTAGVTGSINTTVNGILNLQSVNPSASSGTLAMGVNTLNMGAAATTIGIGDVSGIVRRTSFIPATTYTFGNQFTSIVFQNVGTLPSEVSLKITLGSPPSWKTSAINRVYGIIQTGAVNNIANLNAHYLDNELNGNVENTLVFWRCVFPFTPGTGVEFGRSNFDVTNNWISLSSIPLYLLPSTFGQWEGSMASSALPTSTWNGSVSTDWVDPANWTPNGVPSDLSDVIIPDAATTPNDPITRVDGTVIKSMTIQSGGIVNALAASTITLKGGAGAWSNIGGTFNASTSTVIFTNAAATISGITNFYNVTIDPTAGLTNQSGSITRIAGTMINNGTWSAALNPDNTVEYNGVNQTVLNPNGPTQGYHNLILSGSGTKTMPGTALSIAGDFTMAGTASATALAALTIKGGLILGSGTTFTTGALSHSIAGNVTNNGSAFNATGSTITLNGIIPQTLGGTAQSVFNNLTINNPAGVILGIDETVTGILTFTTGIITTGVNVLKINNVNTAAIVGASPTNYINGNLHRDIAAGANTYSYPIGTSIAYAPANITFAAGTVAGELTGTTSDGDQPNIASSTLAPTSSVNRFWRFTINSGLTTANYGATFNWVSEDEDSPFDYTTAAVGKFTSLSTWIYPTVSARTPTSIAITGASGFGDFQVANGCAAFTATLSGPTIICSGSTDNLVVTMSGGISPYTVVYSGDGGGTITNYISGSNIPVNPPGITTYSLVSVIDAGGCVGTVSGSPTITISLNPTGTWLGTTSTDWNTASNWCGGIPTSTTDVLIPAGGNQPVIGAAGGITRDLAISSGATLTITGSNTLSVYGNWTRAGTFIANNSTVIFDGSGINNIGTSNFYNVSFIGIGPSVAAGNLTITGNVLINDNFNGSSYTHTVAGNWTNNGLFTSDGGTIIFNGLSAQTISGSVESVFNNLTINNVSGVVSNSDLTVNKVLNLQSDNPSVSIGNLALGTYTLNLGSLATVIGIGDVTGIVKRTGFIPGVSYSFGNHYTTITFQNIGTLPTDFSIKTVIGAAPAWKTSGILRIYEVIQNGAVGSFVTINVHYLDIELNGNLEDDLVYWYNQFPFTPGAEVEVGKSNYDQINEWVGLSSIPAQTLPSGFGQLEATLGSSQLTNFTWNGSTDSDWLTPTNWTPNGTPSSGDDVIIPDAASTPNDPVLPNNEWTIGRLTIQNGGVLNAATSSVFTLSGASGAWINIGGTFNASTSTVIFTNAAATIAGTTDFYDVTISSGATLSPVDGTTMRIGGTMTNDGVWNVAQTYIDRDNTVEYNGDNQVILNPNGLISGYGNLILSGTGTKSMPSTDLNIHGDFTLSGTATATALATIDNDGDFTINSGATYVTGTFRHIMDGNFTNNGGSFIATGSNIEFNGSILQTFGGTAVTTFDTITINNSTGVLLDNDEIITGALIFENGIITTGTNTLTISNPAANAISGASIINYINGNLCHDILGGANSYLFPIGTTTTYAPATIDFLSGTTAGTLCSYTTDGDHPSIANSILNPLSSVNRYWSFNIVSGLGTVNYDALFNWVISDQDPLFISNAAIVGKLDPPSTWTYPTVGNHTSSSIAITGASGFSEFLVADACVDPDVPTIVISPGAEVCIGTTVTLSIGTSLLHDATAWQWYTGSCGGTLIGTGTSIMVTPSVTTTYYVRGEGGCVTAGVCTEVTVTIDEQPVVSDQPDQVQCNTSTFTMTQSTPTIGTGEWSIVSGSATITDSLDPVTTITNIAPEDIVIVVWTVTNGSCSAYDEVILSNDAQNIVSDQPDQALCNTSTFTMTQSIPLDGEGVWTLISGSATITDPLDPVTTITGVIAGTSATVRWTVNDAACIAFDDVTVRNDVMPLISNQPDQVQCDMSTFTMTQTAPSYGIGLWTLVLGSDAITDPTSPTTTITGVLPGTSATLRWTVTNGTCIVFDDVALTNDALPIVTDEPDQAQCSNDLFTMTQSAPSVGTGVWTLISGSAVITSPGSPTTTVTDLPAGTSAILRWTVTNGTCIVFDEVTIRNDIEPLISDQPNQAQCNQSTFTMTQNDPSPGTGLWTLIMGSDGITTPTSPTTTITGITAGTSATLRWTVTNGACSVFDDVVLTNDVLPVISDEPDQSQCSGDSFTMTQSAPSVGTGEWTLISGAATITAPGSPTTTITGVATGTSVTVRWTVTNGTCSAFDDVTLVNNPFPECLISGPDALCPSSSAEYSVPIPDIPFEVIYAWTIEGSGEITSASNIQIITVAAGTDCDTSFTLTASVTDVNGCISTCMKTVSVVDTIAPVITGDIVSTTVEGCLEVDATTAATTVAELELLGLTISDACTTDANLVVTSSQTTSGTCPVVVTRTYVITDACSNSTTATQVINVNDTTAPAISGSIDPTTVEGCLEADATTASTTVAELEALGLAISDDCTTDENLVVTSSQTTSGTCPVVVTRTYVITDACSNSTTATQVINVNDTTAPAITGTIDATTVEGCLEADATAAATTVAELELLGLTISDACTTNENLVVTSSQTTSGTCPVVVTRTYFITDACSNSTTATQVINVNDTTAPTITGTIDAITVEGCLEADATATATTVVELELLGLAISDACTTDENLVVTSSQTTSGTCPVVVTRTYVITDACSNSTTATQVINVNDTTAPTITGTIDPTIVEGCLEADATTAATTVAELELLGLTISDACTTDENLIVTSSQTTSGTCPVVVTRTYVITDACSNSTTATQVINVNDTTAPSITGVITPTTVEGCLEADATTAATTVAELELLGLTISDACTTDANLVVTSSETSSGTCPVVVTRTYVITDACSNLTTATQVINVNDTTAPAITGSIDATIVEGCLEADATTAATTVAELELLGLTISDACTTDANLVVTSSQTTSGTCPVIVTRTYVITDACSNSSTATQVINVNDTTAPDITGSLALTTVEGCVTADATAAVTTVSDLELLGLTITDACTTDENLVVTSSQTTSGTCPVVVTRTYVIADACSNSSTAIQVINVNDTTAPMLFGEGADETIDCALSPVFTAPTAEDACDASPVITFEDATIAGSCTGSYTTTRTWVATDACGNTSLPVNQSITVQDITAPVLSGEGLAETIDCPAIPVFTAPTAEDACDAFPVITFEDATIAGSCTGSYIITRTWVATDACGNTSLPVNQSIIVQDITAPVLSDEGLAATIDCPAIPVFTAPTAEDACDASPVITFEDATIAGSCAESFTITRTWMATDACGNTSLHVSQSITVQDITAPVLSGEGADATIDCTSLPVFTAPTATDACDADPVITFENATIAGSCPGSYTITRTWVATDACGNTSLAVSQAITVQDITAPVLSGEGADATIDCALLPVFTAPTAEDACDASPVISFEDATIAGSCPGSYTITRTWVATDACGNTSLPVNQSITVQDITAPVISGEGADATIDCTLLPVFTAPTATDACDASPVITFEDATIAGSCPGSYTITRTWVATDACGNTSLAVSQSITVQDIAAPVLSGEGADATVDCSSLPVFTAPTAEDACDASPVITFEDATISGSCTGSYTITRTWVATDACGNISLPVSQTINVKDITPPVLSGQGIASTINCPATPVFITPIAFDVCDIAPVISFTDTTITGTCFLEYSKTRTWLATDGCGNTSLPVSQTITVKDITPPVLSGEGADVTIDCPAIPVFGAPTAVDGCDIFPFITFTDVTIPGTCFLAYSTTRTWLATDACGNTSLPVSQTITVQDITPPVLSGAGPSITINCPTIPAFHAPTAVDGCDIFPFITFTDVTIPGVCLGTYEKTRTWIATDMCGNTSLPVSQTINVRDVTAPVLSGEGADVTIDCSSLPAFSAPVAADACDAAPVITFEDATIAGPCAGSYTITRTWMATDDCGNTSTVSQTINVQDITLPVIIATGTTLSLGCNPSPEEIEAALGTATVTQGCSMNTLTVTDSPVTGDTCLLSQTRTFSITDVCNNTVIEVSRTITWTHDNGMPVITATGTTLTLGCNPSAADIEAALGTAIVTDNCHINTIIITDGLVAGESVCAVSQTRTFNASDICGNVALSVTRTVTWSIDTQVPVITTSGTTLALGCNPTAADIEAALGTATVEDNCNIDILDIQDGPIEGSQCLYTQTRTFNAKDACGNEAIEASRTITWSEDTIAPVITATGTTLSLGCNPTASDIEAALGTATAADNCTVGIPEVTDGPITGESPCLLSRTRTFNATDQCGNTALQINRTVTWTIDNDDPVITGTIANLIIDGCNITDAPAAATTFADLQSLGISIHDICTADGSLVITSFDVVSGLCPAVITRTYIITDGCTNSASASQVITVQDVTPPHITAGILADCYGTIPLAEAAAIEATQSADDCAGVLNYEVLSTENQSGGILITVTVTDICGNSNSATYNTLINCSQLKVSAFIEGSFDPAIGGMTTLLNEYHILPGQDPIHSTNILAQQLGVASPHGQPYNIAPWNYAGTEGDQYGDDIGDIPYPSSVVDWVLLSVRSGDSLASSEVWKYAALVHNDGAIEIPANSPLLPLTEGAGYYIVLEHRNSLPVMSTKVIAQNSALIFDFRQNQSWILNLGVPLGYGQDHVGGVYMMYPANGEQINTRGDIISPDEGQWLLDNGSLFRYKSGDHDLNGNVDATDEFLWLLNNSIFTLIPF